MRLLSWLGGTDPARRAKPARSRGGRPAGRPLAVERLGDRTLPSFLVPMDYAAGNSPQAVLTADLNGDGRLDLAVANSSDNTVSVRLGDGLGGFGAKSDLATGVNPRSLVVGDVTGDGKLDLITANAGDISVLRGDGGGGFAPADTITLPGQFPPGHVGADPVSQSPRSVATGDFNGDGRLDLAATGVTSDLRSYTGSYGYTYYYTVDNAFVNVLLGTGAGGFAPAVTTPLSGLYPDSLAAGRFNADARDDLAVANDTYFGTVSVLLSNGTGGFSPAADFAADYYPRSVLTADVNGDGITDLVTANSSSASVLLGNGAAGVGNGTFQPARNTAVGSNPTSVAVGDFNADGKLDLVTASNFYTQTGDYYSGYSGYYTGQVSVLLGHGTGTFGLPRTSTVEAGGYLTGVAGGAFNADGFTDVAVTDANNAAVSVLINDQSWPPPPPPTVSVSDATVTEGNGGTASPTIATFTVSLSYASDVAVTVHYATAYGSATAGDFTAASGDVTIPAGETRGTFTVAVTGDRLGEPTETFAVNLTAPVGATVGDGQGVGTILDDEPLVFVGDATVTEGNTGSVNATFTVSLSAVSDVDVTVHYATASGTASTADYTAGSGDVTIPHGQLTRTFTVAVTGDRLAEATESFVVNLTAPVNAGVGDGQGVGTIVDNEPRLSINNVTKKEGNGGAVQFVFTVTLSAAYDQAVTVNYATADGTATAGSDYTAKSGTLTFAAGVTSMTITVTVLPDKASEADETFFVNLSGASGNASIGVARGTGLILDDDLPPGKKK